MQPVINESNFAADVYDAQGKVLVEFFATWCPHCQRQQPITDAAAADLSFPVYQVDVDKSPQLADEYAANGFPTYVLFDNGKPVAEHTGEWPLPNLLAFAREAVSA